MQDYIDRDYIYAAPPPYDCENTTIYAFVFEGDYDLIQGHVDQTLNFEANDARHYRVLSKYLMLTFTHIEKVRTGGAYANKGYGSETEVTWWSLTLGETKKGDKWRVQLLPPHPAFYAPFLFLDVVPPLVGGREIFGFNKQWGKIGMPHSPDEAAEFTLDVFGFKEYGPDNAAGQYPLLNVKRVDEGNTLLERAEAGWESLGDVMGAAAEALGLQAGHGLGEKIGRLADEFFFKLIDAEVPEVFLKEFRDIAQPEKACYQAVTEAKARITRMRGGLLPGQYEMTLNHIDSIPIDTLFGLPHTQKSLFDFWVNVDMTIAPGDVVWEAE